MKRQKIILTLLVYILIQVYVGLAQEQSQDYIHIKLRRSNLPSNQFNTDGSRRNLKSYEKHLQDYLNRQYIGDVYIGKNYQKLELLFDTGTTQTWVPDSKCTAEKGCPHQLFDEKKSFGSFFPGGSDKYKYSFGGTEATFSCKFANDKFSLFDDKHDHQDSEEDKKLEQEGSISGQPEVNHFNFYTVQKVSKFPWSNSQLPFGFKADGVLGLGPHQIPKKANKIENIQSFPWQLAQPTVYDFKNKKELGKDPDENGVIRKQNAVQKAIFGMFIGTIDPETELETESSVTFGGYDKTVITDSMKLEENTKRAGFEGIDWMTITSKDNKEWQVDFVKATMNDKEVTTKEAKAFFVSSSSNIKMPKDSFEFAIKTIQEGHQCQESDFEGLWQCRCKNGHDTTFPSLFIDLKGKDQTDALSYEINSEDYLLYDVKDKKCYIRLEQADGKDWTIGLPFFTEYYSIFDLENFKIGLVKINKGAVAKHISIDTGKEVVKTGTPVFNKEDAENCESNESCWSDLKITKEDLKTKTAEEEKFTQFDESDYKGFQDRTVSGRKCINWTDSNRKASDGTPLVEKYPDLENALNYCRNPEPETHKHIYCFWGTSVSDWEECIPKSLEDYPTQCALIEPFIIENYEIPIHLMKDLRVKRCVSPKKCNQKDPGSQFSVSCDTETDMRLYAPKESDPFVDNSNPNFLDVLGLFVPPSKLSTKYKPFYNIARSDPQCIGSHDIQSKCVDSNLRAGQCVLEKSTKVMGVDISDDLQLQKLTLRKLCMSNADITTMKDDLQIQRIGYTDTIHCIKKDEDSFVFKTEEQLKTTCEVKNIAFSKVFITDKNKGHELIEECEEQAIADEFSIEADMYKNTAFYFIIYVLIMVFTFTILNAAIYGVDKLGDTLQYCNKQILYSKNNKFYKNYIKLNFPDQKGEDGFIAPGDEQTKKTKLVSLDPSAYHNRPSFQVLASKLQWDYETMEDWREEKEAIMKLPINSQVNLQRLAIFFAKTVDKIALKDTTDSVYVEAFDIREIIRNKFPYKYNIDFQYIMTHIEALQFTQKYKMWQYSDRISKAQFSTLQAQQLVFKAEVKRLQYQQGKVPSVLTLANFNKSPVMSLQIGQDLINSEHRSSVAIGMAMFAQGQYPEFRQQMESFFGMTQARHWNLYSYFEKDYQLVTDFRPPVLTVWKHLDQYSAPALLAIRFKFIAWAQSTYFLMAIFGAIHATIHAFYLPLLTKYYLTFSGLPVLILYLVVITVIVLVLGGTLPKPAEKFETLRDMVALTLTCDIEELWDAYDHFRRIPKVRVVALDEKLDTLNMIEVTFIYNECFIGTMQFRYKSYPMHWRAEFFLLDLERCRTRISINDTLNKQAVWLTDTHPDYLIMEKQGDPMSMMGRDSEFKAEDVIPPIQNEKQNDFIPPAGNEKQNDRYVDPQEHVMVQDHSDIAEAEQLDPNAAVPENINLLNQQDQ